ncbi:MAG TPA: hypothetical protein VMF89_19730 [Polyangiales bacterium]|nr:hypothetical protein [Polyangiales bacterium]
MTSVAKTSVLAVCALFLVASCNDDFSRFQFGEKKKAAKTRDAGVQNVSDETGTDPDGGAGDAAAQSE